MEKKPKIIVVGSFMMDLIASAPRVPNLGETVIGDSFRTAPGGKGVNQAVQCARLGADVTMVGCVGTDAFGDEMLAAAADSGVDVSHVKRSSEHASGVGCIQLQTVNGQTQNRILVVPGANYDLAPADLEWLREGVREYDLMMLQLELSYETTLFAAQCAKAAGVPVMLNPAPAAPLTPELLGCVTYLSPNEHEAALLSGIPIPASEAGVDEFSLRSAMSALINKGAKKVIVTLGSNGSVIFDGKDVVRAACVRMENVCDPTAAGDSFVAAFCTGVTSGLGEREALEFASHVSALTVCGMGAIPSLPTTEQVRELMESRGRDTAELAVFHMREAA